MPRSADDDLERMSDIQADRGIIAGLFDALLLVADGRGAQDRPWEGHADPAHGRNIVRQVVKSCAPGRVVRVLGPTKIVGMALNGKTVGWEKGGQAGEYCGGRRII